VGLVWGVAAAVGAADFCRPGVLLVRHGARVCSSDGIWDRVVFGFSAPLGPIHDFFRRAGCVFFGASYWFFMVWGGLFQDINSPLVAGPAAPLWAGAWGWGGIRLLSHNILWVYGFFSELWSRPQNLRKSCCYCFLWAGDEPPNLVLVVTLEGWHGEYGPVGTRPTGW